MERKVCNRNWRLVVDVDNLTARNVTSYDEYNYSDLAPLRGTNVRKYPRLNVRLEISR